MDEIVGLQNGSGEYDACGRNGPGPGSLVQLPEKINSLVYQEVPLTKYRPFFKMCIYDNCTNITAKWNNAL